MKNIIKLSHKATPDQFTYKVRVTPTQTTHPKFTFTAGYPPVYIDWGDGSIRTTATSATEYTHTYVAAGEYTVTLILANQAKWLTQVDISEDKVISVVTPLQIFLAMTLFNGYANTAWIQNISNHVLPKTLTQYSIYNTGVTGNIAGQVLPTTLITYDVYGTEVTGCPDLSSMIAIESIRADNCTLSQTTVDLYLNRCAVIEAQTTYATPTLNLGGTGATKNAIPSVQGIADAATLTLTGWIVTISS